MENRKESGCLSILLISVGVIVIAFSWLSYLFGTAGYQMKKGGVFLPIFSINEAIKWTVIGISLVIVAKLLDLIAYKTNKNKLNNNGN